MHIAITGRGIVSPVAIGVPAFREALWRGESGIRPIERFDTSAFKLKQAGVVDEERVASALEYDREVDTATTFLLHAAGEALRDAGCADAPASSREHLGVVLGTNFGGSGAGENVLRALHGEGDATAYECAESMFSTAADHAACYCSLGGPREVLSLSCSSGTAAVARAAEVLESGRATGVLVGGYDAISPLAWSGLSALRTMTRNTIQPFDKNRSGTIFSEGAACLMLEPREQAEQRGAPIYAELLGWATNNNAFHMTAPAKGGAGSAAVMKAALEDAGIEPSDIDHVNTHGTGTRPNDSTETEALKTVLGSHAYEVPITSIKSMTGHMMGAAGSAEAIASVEAVRSNSIPPTINYSEPDPECDLDVVANEARECSIETVLSNSAGIGGCNAAVVIGQAE